MSWKHLLTAVSHSMWSWPSIVNILLKNTRSLQGETYLNNRSLFALSMDYIWAVVQQFSCGQKIVSHNPIPWAQHWSYNGRYSVQNCALKIVSLVSKVPDQICISKLPFNTSSCHILLFFWYCLFMKLFACSEQLEVEIQGTLLWASILHTMLAFFGDGTSLLVWMCRSLAFMGPVMQIKCCKRSNILDNDAYLCIRRNAFGAKAKGRASKRLITRASQLPTDLK